MPSVNGTFGLTLSKAVSSRGFPGDPLGSFRLGFVFFRGPAKVALFLVVSLLSLPKRGTLEKKDTQIKILSVNRLKLFKTVPI